MQKKRPRKVSPRYLERAATFYLDRYDSSAANLKAVLMRKVDRSLKEHGGDRAEAEKWADEVVARFVAAGLVDDTRFAGRKAGSLHRRGNSSSLIRMKLRSKGLGDEAIDVAIDRLKQEAADPDLEAAVGWARRRKLGPWRRDLSTRSDNRQKDMAVLARRGFRYDIVQKVIDADTPDELFELLEG
jgi:regulatory protein